MKSIQAYRKSQGIAPRSKVTRRIQRLPLDHPVRPYKSALGLVPDEDIAEASGVAVEVVQALREAFGLDAVAPSLTWPGRRLSRTTTAPDSVTNRSWALCLPPN